MFPKYLPTPVTSVECQHSPKTESQASRLMLPPCPTPTPGAGSSVQPGQCAQDWGSPWGPHLEKRLDGRPVKIPGPQGPRIPVGLGGGGRQCPLRGCGTMEPGWLEATAGEIVRLHPCFCKVETHECTAHALRRWRRRATESTQDAGARCALGKRGLL